MRSAEHELWKVLLSSVRQFAHDDVDAAATRTPARRKDRIVCLSVNGVIRSPEQPVTSELLQGDPENPGPPEMSVS
jgi:hypothetical protein